MRVEQNTISRDWTILRKGRKYFVNFTESDGQTLALCSRGNWEVAKETEDDIEELSACVCEDNATLIKELITFCIDNWDNEFVQEIQDELHVQGAFLKG